MPRLYAILGGLLSGVMGMVLAFFAGDIATRAHGMSDFEGERAYFVAFVLGPLGFLAGLALGWWQLRRVGEARFLAREARAIGSTVLLVAAAGGLGWVTADRAPMIEGRTLTLQFEVRVPLDRPLPEDLKAAGFHASLYATHSDNQFADLQFDAVTRRDGYVVIPGSAGLYSQTAPRLLLIGLQGSPSQVFAVRLLPRPTSKDEAWSEWTAPTQRADGTPVPAAEQYEVRYRVQPDST